MDDQDRKRARPTQIVVDLKALRDPWLEWCKSRGLTPSEALRRILTAVVQDEPNSDVTPNPADFAGAAGVARRRVEIRIPEAEFLALAAAADREGMSVPRWLAGLVRTQLSGDQLFVDHEVAVLARSNQLLLALGRNINQIAYNMNQRADSEALTLAQVDYVRAFLKTHVAEVAALLHASSRRWRQ